MAEGPRRSLASGPFPLPMPWLFAKGTLITILPPVPLLSTQGTLALCGDPWALWPARARLAQKSWFPLWWSLSGQNHCNRLGLLHISLGAFSLFGHIPIPENQISQLEQIIHWSLRTSSCFLNFAPDGWGRLGYEMHSQRACASGEEGSMFIWDPWPCRVGQLKCPLCPS